MTAECRNLRRCVAYDGSRGLTAEPRLDGGPLCDGCLGRARFDVAALHSDYIELTAELAPAGGSVSDHVTGGDPEAPIPLALHIDELQRNIVWTLTAWELPLREALGLPEPVTAGVRPSWVVAKASRLIAVRIRALASLGPTWGYADGLDAGPVERDGVYAVESLRAVHLAAERAVGATPLVRSLPGACTRCGGHGALLRDDGSDLVRCAACGSSETYDAYRAGYGMTGV